MLNVIEGLAHPLHPSREGMLWWAERCKSKSAKRQIALVGLDAPTLEELYMKYGDPKKKRASALPMFR